MSERIDYYGVARGFKDNEELDDFWQLAAMFQHGPDMDAVKHDKYVAFDLKEGWRGAGLSCEEILSEWFGEWIAEHPHVKLTVECCYIDHAPQETIKVTGENYE